MFSQASRDSYLQDQWSRYPLTPVDFSDRNPILVNGKAYYAGRIQKIDDQTLELSLLGEEKKYLKTNDSVYLGVFTKETLRFKSEVVAALVLQPGDVVLLSAKEGRVLQLQLLVPGNNAVECGTFEKSLVSCWSDFLGLVRGHFSDMGFLEVATPSLVESPGVEPYLESFETTLRSGDDKKTRHLPTSPELHLKKCLTQFSGKIFEIKRCFRNNEKGSWHQPEFLMLEWYRSYSCLDRIAEDLEGLLKKTINQNLEFAVVTFAKLFQDLLAFELTPKTTKSELADLCSSQDIYFQDTDLWDDLFHRLFLERIDPWLKENDFVLIRDFPPQLMSLAKLTAGGWSDRFELYASGVELANAFQELNDADEQSRRIEIANQEKVKLGLPPFPVDRDFIKALEFGMPPCAGIALGLERLFMIRNQITDIKNAVLFAHKT